MPLIPFEVPTADFAVENPAKLSVKSFVQKKTVNHGESAFQTGLFQILIKFSTQ